MRAKIHEAIEGVRGAFGGRLHYYENERNLGYDANLRRLVSRAEGDYCMFMGDDDLVAPGALRSVESAILRHGQFGVILRSYVSFTGSPDNTVEEYRYFDGIVCFRRVREL